jgi:hypothetical protein
MAPTQYRPNRPRIVDETIDGEALIIDMVNGAYFSCVGASAVAWTALSSGATVDEIADLLAAAYRVPTADARRDVEQFVAALLDDMLLVAPAEPTPPPAERPPIVLGALGGAYEPPRLEKYTDLADLILLDPVHDVSVAGWPDPA